MAYLNVLFHVPEHIQQGVQSKTYEVVGGVVRRVDGKQVVAWLRPAWEEFAEAGQGGAPLPAGGPIAGELAQLAGDGLSIVMGLQLVNVAVSVAGFAILNHKLNQVLAKLDRVLTELGKVVESLDWLKRAVVNANRDRLINAIESAARAQARGDLTALNGELTNIGRARDFFLGQMEAMLDANVALTRADVFVSMAQLSAIACAARAQAEWALMGPDSALEVARRDASRYAQLRARFLAPLQNVPGTLPYLLCLNAAQRKSLRTALGGLPAVTDVDTRLPDWSGRPEAVAEFARVALPQRGEPEALILVALGPDDASPAPSASATMA